MCVKEFCGYNCGHCSVPVLRRCPLSASNDQYPVCEYPAERPIFTNEFCHPCSRVVWNNKILKEEEEHRGRHQRGECFCEVIFDQEEREKRLRPRSKKGKGRVRDEHSESGVWGGAEMSREQREHGYDIFSGGGYGGGGDGNANWGMDRGPSRLVETGPDTTRQGWSTEAKLASYGYVGFQTGTDSRSHMGHEQGYVGPDDNGHFQHEQGYAQQATPWNGQLMMGDAGAGMKWYPRNVVSRFPSLPPIQTQFNDYLPPRTQSASNGPTIWQKALSEPAYTSDYQESLLAEDLRIEELDDKTEVGDGPLVVSSDMARGS